ncbi:hypothetical protein AAFM46_10435 [Arthrobacter sp. TMP15]|uniref:hypothetical protein n=1 Tax=Arthrobacter sp. TMP15 TaxID=3140789 RepID=UPI0031BB5865
MKSRITGAIKSKKLPSQSSIIISADELPDTENNTVAWIEEHLEHDLRKEISPRIRLSSLRQIVKVENWLRTPNTDCKEAESLAMAEILHYWDFMGIVSLENRATRIVNDTLRRLQRVKSIKSNSRLISVCTKYRGSTPLQNSLPGNIISGLESLIELHNILVADPLRVKNIIVHPSNQRCSILPDSTRKALEKSATYLRAESDNTTMGRIIQGYISSLVNNRKQAHQTMLAAISSQPSLVISFGLDLGAITYGFSSTDISYEPAAISWHSEEPISNTGITILYSGNIPFLRRYLGRIFYYLIAQPTLSTHIHIVADNMDATAFIIEANRLLSNLFEFSHRESVRPYISWSSQTPPREVGNLITYYACARYLVADEVMKRYNTSIWIQDVDLFPTAPTISANHRLQEYDVALVESGGLNFLAPWRRYLAGNVYISQSDNGRDFLKYTVEYIISFLSVEDSWMLDQNALDWAIEKSSTDTLIGNMKFLDIHLTQTTMNATIES